MAGHKFVRVSINQYIQEGVPLNAHVNHKEFALPNAEPARNDLLKLASGIVAAYVSNNPVAVGDLPALVKSVHATLGGLSGADGFNAAATRQKPAVPISKSITPDYLVCLEDGKRLKMLKRYLRSRFNGMSPDQYRAKWGLPVDYPMVCANYAAKRSEFAKKIGLGRTRGSKTRRRNSKK